MAARKLPWKPGPNHPWNERTRLSVAIAERRKRRRGNFVDVFEDLRSEEEAHDRLEAAELEKSIRRYFE